MSVYRGEWHWYARRIVKITGGWLRRLLKWWRERQK